MPQAAPAEGGGPYAGRQSDYIIAQRKDEIKRAAVNSRSGVAFFPDLCYTVFSE